MKKRILVVLMTLFAAGTLSAQNSNDALRLSEPGILSGAKALSMGNSIGALGGDFSSIFMNPAGLALFDFSQLAISGFNNNFSNNTSYYNNQMSNSANAMNFSQAGMVFKLPVTRGSLVLSVGYNRLKDFNRLVQFSGYNFENNSLIQDLASERSNFAYEAGVTYGLNNNRDTTLINGRLQQSGKTTDEGGIDIWSFGGAVELQKNFFVGGSVNVISGKFDRRRQYFETDPYRIYSSIRLDPSEAGTTGFRQFSYIDSYGWEISGWDLMVGFIYKIKEKATIGATVKIPRQITIKENYRESASGEFATTIFQATPENSSYEYEISTPFEFTIGGSYRIDRLTLAGEAKYIDFTQMKFTEGLTALKRDNINFGIKDDFRGTLNFNFGAEYSLYELGIKLRGGVMVMKSPYKGDPEEYDKKFITAGVGFPFDQMEFDVAIAHGWWKDFEYNYDSATSPVLQDIKSTTVMATLKYNF